MTTLVLLDRDGVINHDSDDYIKSPDEWQAINGSLEAIAKLHKAGFVIAIVTNQSGLGRGLFSLATLYAIHAKMLSQIEALGGRIDALAYCPHHPDTQCACRKPRTGLVTYIYAQLGCSEFDHSYLVGDTAKDIGLAQAIGAEPILVLTGKGAYTHATATDQCYQCVANLLEASEYIQAQMHSV